MESTPTPSTLQYASEGEQASTSLTSFSTPLRVAVVVRPATGGIRRHVTDLLSNLDRQLVVPTLFAPADFSLEQPLSDVARHDINIGARTRPLNDLRAARQLAQLMRGNFDIVHAHGLRGAVVGGLAARIAKVPFLFTAHNQTPRMNALQSIVFRQIAKQADRVIAVSPTVAQGLIACGVLSQIIEVIPNGVDMSRFCNLEHASELKRHDLGIAEEEMLLLAVGRLSPEKGFDVLLEAFASVAEQNPMVRLVIVGAGAEEEHLRQQAVRLAVPVIFTGYVPEVASLMATTDIVVVPSREEGQGIVALEAMAAYRPIVASRVGGLVDTVEDGVTGALVPAGDPASLAGTLTALLSDPKRRERFGRAGRERVEMNYRLEAQIRKIEKVYRDVYRRAA